MKTNEGVTIKSGSGFCSCCGSSFYVKEEVTMHNPGIMVVMGNVELKHTSHSTSMHIKAKHSTVVETRNGPLTVEILEC